MKLYTLKSCSLENPVDITKGIVFLYYWDVICPNQLHSTYSTKKQLHSPFSTKEKLMRVPGTPCFQSQCELCNGAMDKLNKKDH